MQWNYGEHQFYRETTELAALKTTAYTTQETESRSIKLKSAYRPFVTMPKIET